MLLRKTSSALSVGGIYWGRGGWSWKGNVHKHAHLKTNLKCKKGLQRWEQELKSQLRACKYSAAKQQSSVCPVLIYKRPTKQMQVIWADAAEASQMARAPANLFIASLKQFQNQFGIWQAVRTLLLLRDGSDMLTAIRLLHARIGACSAYSLLEEPKKRYYNHLTWGHGHMLYDLCLCRQSPRWYFAFCP